MTDTLRCLNEGGKTPCEGPVEYRLRPSDWKSFPRCDRHHEQRIANVSETERYADSAVPPPGFDEAAIGERFHDDY
jgi:hypothetical protein